MLFQPTNISPDVINGIGNGTVDANDGLTVSWQVNGNSPMYAYQIFIYLNNASSTLVFNNSGNPTILATPFNGVDYKGDIQRFYSDHYSKITLGISNGKQYKLMVRQWYANPNSSPDAYIDQRSMSVFNTKAAPTLSLTVKDGTGSTVSVGSDLATRNATITGTYAQANGDAIVCAQWKINAMIETYEGSGEYFYVTIHDSGKIYGTSDLKCVYDGFINNSSYQVVLELETTSGVTISAERVIETHWTTTSLTANTSVCKINNQSTAIQVVWNGYSNIPGRIVNGSPTLSDSRMYLDSNDSVIWDVENGHALAITADWMFIMRTKLMMKDASNLLKLITTNGNLVITYTVSSRSLTIASGYQSGSSKSITVPSEAYVTIIVSGTQIIIKWDYLSGGLTPSATLTPSTTLAPADGDTWVFNTNTTALSGTQGTLSGIQLSSNQTVDYIQIFGDSTSAETITNVINEATTFSISNELCYYPTIYNYSGYVFLTDFTIGYGAGSLQVAGTNISGWAIYRKKETELFATHLTDTSPTADRIIDYGCGSGEGMYHYEIYPIGAAKYLSGAIVTASFNPCFENWAVLEAEYDSAHDQYKVLNEYIFGKNLSSGSISNNNTPNVYSNFTQYATVLKSTQNYQSGTLSSLIGYVGYISYIVQSGDTLQGIASRFGTTKEKIIEDNEIIQGSGYVTVGMRLIVKLTNGAGTYFDDKKLRDAIWNLSTSANTLFLKSRKGDVIEIQPSKDISMSYLDGNIGQATTVSFPWVQIGDASDKMIVG